ncbi:putative thiol oxidoreductase [Sinorhizobium sojae CCBAU 05684]|uniref:Putative thiol oxidoreductase n=1 Tax=Sinorhizobium sojae CCBAU 05684 TaxID=716928 RepID=A0A249PGI4_9HYPH|nr:putative thiol oxidoreductase [Sinorhizobium sojae CCBAU 05684]
MNVPTIRFLALSGALLAATAALTREGPGPAASVEAERIAIAKADTRLCPAEQGRGRCLPERDDLSGHDRERVLKVTRPATDFSNAEQFEAMSGGATTTLAPLDEKVFSQFFANLPFEAEQSFELGKALFEKLWSPPLPPRRPLTGSGRSTMHGHAPAAIREMDAVVRPRDRRMRRRCSTASPGRRVTRPSGR